MTSLIYGNAVAIDGAEIELSMTIDGGEIELSLEIDGAEAGVFYDTGGGSFPVYPGPYLVEPIFEDIILNTAQHILNQDVTVKEIYVGRVTNPSGGKTVTIGG